MAKYTLRVKNDSSQTGDVCVYQIHPYQKNNTNIYSLAWFSKGCLSGTELTFEWKQEYSFAWSETGELVPGVVFEAAEGKRADPQNNIAVLGKENDAFLFKDTTLEGQEGVLTIKADGTIPTNVVSIGIEMDGNPAIAMTASPNMDHTFMPHPTYWVAFGDFSQGQILDTNNMSGAMELKFDSGVCDKSVTFAKDNLWKEG